MRGIRDCLLHSVVSGKTALHWAGAVNNSDGTLLLLKHGAQKDSQNHKVMLLLVLV